MQQTSSPQPRPRSTSRGTSLSIPSSLRQRLWERSQEEWVEEVLIIRAAIRRALPAMEKPDFRFLPRQEWWQGSTERYSITLTAEHYRRLSAIAEARDREMMHCLRDIFCRSFPPPK